MFESVADALRPAHVGGSAFAIALIADEDLERADETKTSAVHFMRFELTLEMVQALKEGAQLSAGIDHENYLVEVSPVADNIRLSLLGDLD